MEVHEAIAISTSRRLRIPAEHQIVPGGNGIIRFDRLIAIFIALWIVV